MNRNAIGGRVHYRCGSVQWLPRRHGPLRTFDKSRIHDHLTVSNFIPRALSIRTTKSSRDPDISIADLHILLEHYMLTPTLIPSVSSRVSNEDNRYWFLIETSLFLYSHLYSELFTYLSSHYRHFPHISMYANATSEVPKSSAFSDYVGNRADCGLGPHMSTLSGATCSPYSVFA